LAVGAHVRFTIYNAVYCALQIPSNIAVLHVRPSWWLAGCEIGWAIFTFAQAGARNTTDMYVFRFFVAFFEAGFQVSPFSRRPVCSTKAIAGILLSDRIVVYAQRTGQAHIDLVCRRSRRTSLFRLHAGRHLQDPRRQARPRRLAMALHHLWMHQ
jgi:hypothetical protein